jgi:hypothetical protein
MNIYLHVNGTLEFFKSELPHIPRVGELMAFSSKPFTYEVFEVFHDYKYNRIVLSIKPI